MTENWGKLSSVNLVARHTVVMDCTARSAHACGWLVLYCFPRSGFTPNHSTLSNIRFDQLQAPCRISDKVRNLGKSPQHIV